MDVLEALTFCLERGIALRLSFYRGGNKFCFWGPRWMGL